MNRRFRFILKGMLVAVVVAAAFYSGIRVERKLVERERLRLELEVQAREIDQLMARLNALMEEDRPLDEESRREAEAFDIARKLMQVEP